MRHSRHFARFSIGRCQWKQFSGGLTGGATPDPISNSEVKTSRADGTAGETLWESRSPPGIIPSPEPTTPIVGSGLFYCPSSGPPRQTVVVEPPNPRGGAQQRAWLRSRAGSPARTALPEPPRRLHGTAGARFECSHSALPALSLALNFIVWRRCRHGWREKPIRGSVRGH